MMIDVKGSQNRKRNPIVHLVIECLLCSYYFPKSLRLGSMFSES